MLAKFRWKVRIFSKVKNYVQLKSIWLPFATNVHTFAHPTSSFPPWPPLLLFSIMHDHEIVINDTVPKYLPLTTKIAQVFHHFWPFEIARFAICIRCEYQWKNSKKSEETKKERRLDTQKLFFIITEKNIQMHISVSTCFTIRVSLNSCEKKEKVLSKCYYMLGKMSLMIIPASHGVSENFRECESSTRMMW